MDDHTLYFIGVLSITLLYLASANSQESAFNESQGLNGQQNDELKIDQPKMKTERSRVRHHRLRAKHSRKESSQENIELELESNIQSSHENNRRRSKERTQHAATTKSSRKNNRANKNRNGLQPEHIIESFAAGNSGASHQPLFGSEPPSIPPDIQLNLNEDAKGNANEPLEQLYADQPVSDDRELRANENNLDNSIPDIEKRISENPLDDLNYDSLVLDSSEILEFASDLELTTQGRAERSSEESDFASQGDWNDPEFMKDLVTQLQDELRESKSTTRMTRSVLSTLEEKQNAQALDMRRLKDEVLNIRKQQNDQRERLQNLESEVENTAWGMQDIKEMNDQMTHDFSALKTLQLAHNDTMVFLTELSESNMAEHEQHAGAIKNLQYQLLDVRTQLDQDGDDIDYLQQIIRDAKHSNSRGNPRVLHNNIPIIPALTDYVSSENSGVGSNSQEFHTYDSLASSIEEKHNVIGDHLSRIIAREEQMEQELTRMRYRFSSYESRLAKLHEFFVNVSAKISENENEVLTNQNSHNDVTSLGAIAAQMMNFTEQLVHMQQWHMTTKASVNKTWDNQQSVAELENFLENHGLRLSNLEDRMERSRQHRQDSNGLFEDFEDRIKELENNLRRTDRKFAQIQIKMLNESLDTCQKVTSTLKLENQLEELDKGLGKVENRLEASAEKSNKIERGVSKLFELSDKQGLALSRLVSTVQDVGDLLPVLSGVQMDITNLLSQLPADCNEVQLHDVTAQSGVYLIHARDSGTSARLACEFDGSSAWTVIQQRFDGNTSFARTWQEYQFGFGDSDSEFWIGNEYLHHLTSQDNYQLQIDMVDLDDQYYWARYDVFHVGDEDSLYSLELGDYRGNATDALKYSNHMPFSTIDRDNDVSSTNCAKFYTAGWWYKHCHYANLNGRYTVGIVWFNHDLDEWVQMKKTSMKIRPLKREYSAEDNRTLS